MAFSFDKEDTMTEQERAESIEFIVWAIKEVEGVIVPASHFKKKTDEQLADDVEWYDYLLSK